METEITKGPKGVPALLYLILWHIGSFAPTETLLLGLMALQNFLGTERTPFHLKDHSLIISSYHLFIWYFGIFIHLLLQWMPSGFLEHAKRDLMISSNKNVLVWKCVRHAVGYSCAQHVWTTFPIAEVVWTGGIGWKYADSDETSNVQRIVHYFVLNIACRWQRMIIL